MRPRPRSWPPGCEAADAALRRMLGAAVDSDEMAAAADLARRAAERAGRRTEGRPLFAAHAGLPWPDHPPWCCGTPRPCCVSSGATVTSPRWSSTISIRWRRWSCTWPPASCPWRSSGAPGGGPTASGRPAWTGWWPGGWSTGWRPPRPAPVPSVAHATGGGPPRGHRGRDRPLGRLRLRGAGRDGMCRAPEAGPAVQPGGGGRGRLRVLTSARRTGTPGREAAPGYPSGHGEPNEATRPLGDLDVLEL